MLLGMYYLSKEYNKADFLEVAEIYEKKGDVKMAEDYRYFAECDGKVFSDVDSVMLAYSTNQIHAHNRVVVRMSGMNKPCFSKYDQGDYVLTSVGKIIFNTIFPIDFQYLNEFNTASFTKMDDRFIIKKGTNIKEYVENLPVAKPYKKGDVGPIIREVFDKFKTIETSKMLDKLKDLGFKYSTIAGITVSASDVVRSSEKETIIAQSKAKVEKVNKQFQRGLITEQERYASVIEIWTQANDEVKKELKALSEGNFDNPLFMMMNSGARGKLSNFTQLAGMRGLMAKPDGSTVEIPITSNFVEGLSVSEFFLSSHGSRKGSADTALRTADSGYLTRRLVDVAQDIIVKEEDCGCLSGLVVSAVCTTTLIFTELTSISKLNLSAPVPKLTSSSCSDI
jgi:DNA-directed RNA polymerase subunit beta'